MCLTMCLQYVKLMFYLIRHRKGIKASDQSFSGRLPPTKLNAVSSTYVTAKL